MKNKKSKLPEGVAADYYDLMDSTVCILVKADKPTSNKMPRGICHYEPLAVGKAWLHPNDEWRTKKGRKVARKRALEMYYETFSVGEFLELFSE